MTPNLRSAFAKEIADFKNQLIKNSHSAAWAHLERAHILGQFFVWPHLSTHFYMITFAINTKNFKEILGQVPRLLMAAPGSFFGKAPRGNTGGANVGIFQPMEIPDDLKEILKS